VGVVIAAERCPHHFPERPVEHHPRHGHESQEYPQPFAVDFPICRRTQYLFKYRQLFSSLLTVIASSRRLRGNLRFPLLLFLKPEARIPKPVFLFAIHLPRRLTKEFFKFNHDFP
jgi:hypothetical protein